MHQPSWPPAYPGLSTWPTDQKSDLRTWVSREDHRRFLSVATNNSLISHFLAHVFKSAVDHIKRNNLTYLDADEFVECICKCTVSFPHKETVKPHESGRVAAILDAATHGTVVPADVGKAVENGVSGQGGKGRSKGAKGTAKKS